MTYAEKLKDPRWQKKRLEILSDRDWACESCGDKEHTLNVHHRIYKAGASPWEYIDADFVVLCDRCHTKEHNNREEYIGLVVGELKHIFLSAGLLDLAGLLFAISATYDGKAQKIIMEALEDIPH